MVGEKGQEGFLNHKYAPPTCERFEHFSPRASHRRSIEPELITAKSSNRSRGVYENRVRGAPAELLNNGEAKGNVGIWKYGNGRIDELTNGGNVMWEYESMEMGELTN